MWCFAVLVRSLLNSFGSDATHGRQPAVCSRNGQGRVQEAIDQLQVLAFLTANRILGDGSIDITSIFENGRLVRREISDPALIPL